MLTRVWIKGNPQAVLVGLQIGVATIENSMEVPQKIKNETALLPSNSLLAYLFKEIQNSNSKR